MKNLLRIKTTLHVCICAILLIAGLGAQAQNNPNVRASFGIEGDMYANKRDFGTFMGSGTNDWFKTSNTPAGVGVGIIDTNGRAAINAAFTNVAARNVSFTKGMSCKAYSVINNKLYTDAGYIRDNHKTDPSAYITSNKNGQNPSVWQGGTSQVNAKDDILDGMVAYARNGNTLSDSLWMMGAISLIGTNGSHYFDMEFYQTDFAYGESSQIFTGVGPDAGHTSWIFDNNGKVIQMGDFIVASTFNNFGITDLEFRIWVNITTYQNVIPNGFKFDGAFDGATPNGCMYGYASIRPNNTTQSFFFGAVNTASTVAAPWGALDQQSNLYTNYTASQFLEFGINFTKLGVDPASTSSFANGSPCKDIARKLVIKSRTSHSFMSSLVDFLGPMNLAKPKIGVNAGADKKICYEKATSITANVTNSNLYANPVISWTADMGGSILGATTGVSVTALTPGRYIVTTSRFAGCEIDSRDTVIVRGDRDCDNVLDAFDVDDDNDALSDAVEIGTGGVLSDPSGDVDGDFIPNYKDVDFCVLNSKGVCQSLDKDGDGIINQFDLDADNDGVSDLVEAGGVDTNGDGLVDIKIDSNGNGLYDTYDVLMAGYSLNSAYDKDGDGKNNFLDLDSDNDGISDIVESGGTDSNGDGMVDTFIDNDGDGLQDYVDADLGNDGIGIVTESALIRTGLDTNNDGAPESYMKDASVVDTDILPNYLDLDSDNDGIPDIREVGGLDNNNDGQVDNFTDTDNDGWAQNVDGDNNNDGLVESFTAVLLVTPLDANNNGRPDMINLMANHDKSGYPNPYDIDSDDDGIVDTREVGINDDADFNGTTNGPDANNNGWSDVVEGLATLDIPNSDAQGKENYLDIDSDDDGIPDNVEGQYTFFYVNLSYLDSDKDGLDNAYDNNNLVFGGNSNNGINPLNVDGDAYPDYLDEDADDDTYLDIEEGWDTNGNGVLSNGEVICTDAEDSDGDGLRNAFDAQNTNYSPNNATTPFSYPDARYAGAERDWRDLTPLPVALVDFYAQNIEDAVKLTWDVAHELSVAQYDIERSENGSDFQKVGEVTANQSPTYKFIDETPNDGANYYRLRTIDIDGRSVYSTVVLVNFEDKGIISLYPNPATNEINVMIPANWVKEGVTLTISDMSGRILRQQSVESTKDTHINLENMANGVYNVKVNNGTSARYSKFVIAR
jgi:Secretion system C-terminal sorting domain